jgi:SAM-dependent methyltransferase
LAENRGKLAGSMPKRRKQSNDDIVVDMPVSNSGGVSDVREPMSWTEDEQRVVITKVFAVFESTTLRNCHSGNVGVGGTVTVMGLVSILRALTLDDEGSTVFDFGCGFGRVLLSALALGFNGAYGCELPDNDPQRIVFEAVKAKVTLPPNSKLFCKWLGQDILDLELPDQLWHQISAVYSFWCGMDLPVQNRILELCKEKFINIRSLAVYRTREWPTPESGMMSLRAFPQGPQHLMLPFPTSPGSSQQRATPKNLDAFQDHPNPKCGLW